MSELLTLACIFIPFIVSLVCLLALCFAIGRFANKIHSQMPQEAERSVLFEIEENGDEVQETAL